MVSALAALRRLLPKRVSGTPARRNRVLERLAVYSYQFRFPRSLSRLLPDHPDSTNFQLVSEMPDIRSQRHIQEGYQTGARSAEVFVHQLLDISGMLV